VHTLILESCNIESVPGGMLSLECIDVSSCQNIAADWLPETCRDRVRVVDAARSNIEAIPDGARVLEAVRVEGCKRLAADWLPASSAQCVRFVDAEGSNLQRLPSGMTALAAVAITGCTDLAADWLPDSSAADVRQLGTVSEDDFLQEHDRLTLQTILPLQCLPSQEVYAATDLGVFSRNRLLQFARAQPLTLAGCVPLHLLSEELSNLYI
jgi:hypothetical protein